MRTIKVRTGSVPDECNYLTPGKVYEGVRYLSEGAVIQDDNGNEQLLCVPMCAHLDFEAWEVVDE